MAFDSIYALQPINGTAAAVVSQAGCTERESLSRKELVEILNRLTRKQRLLRHALSIKNDRQHRNLIYKTNKLWVTSRGKENPRAAIEYVLNGRQIQSISQELANMKRERKAKRSKLKEVGND